MSKVIDPARENLPTAVEGLGMTPIRNVAKSHSLAVTGPRALFEAGIFVLRDNPQGKRYGRRDPAGRIIEAFGFDLSPLAERHAEFVRLAAEARTERNHMKELRGRITMARRAICQAGEMLEALGPMPEGWRHL